MPRRSPAVTICVVVACLLGAGFAQRRLEEQDRPLMRSMHETANITPELRRAGLRFADGVAPADRQWIETALAAARPEAQRLIAEVDGTVLIDTAGTGEPLGETRPGPDGFTVWFNLVRLNGSRQSDRNTTVLHEFGHVLDIALIDAAMDERLDAGIPRTGNCVQQDGTAFGACAATEERIADTFAKWALGGAVSAVGAGYAIAVPASLEEWGAPLAALAQSLRS